MLIRKLSRLMKASTEPSVEYWGKPGLPFAMVQCLHQSNGYMKRNLGLCRVQICIPLVATISAHPCAGPQTTPTHVRQYRAEYGILGNPGLPFAMVQCLHQSNYYIKRKLPLWTVQKYIPLVGAISALTCDSPQTSPTHIMQYRAEYGILGKSGATFHHGAVFAPKQ